MSLTRLKPSFDGKYSPLIAWIANSESFEKMTLELARINAF